MPGRHPAAQRRLQVELDTAADPAVSRFSAALRVEVGQDQGPAGAHRFHDSAASRASRPSRADQKSADPVLANPASLAVADSERSAGGRTSNRRVIRAGFASRW